MRRSDVALCGFALAFLLPLFWTLCRIIYDVAMDIPMEQQPYVPPDVW